mmetsp:Transcript_60899/g.143875  ORF Transcript_60899/g.143875 Transcript_60899/m.143875 type:complete len:214 (-) Transcript_60899:891-1532(-)
MPCVVVDGVDKKVECHGSASEEGAPPPSIVLRTELKVDEHNRHLGHGNDEDGRDKEEETEHVVEPVLPDRPQDDCQLDEHNAEWEHTRQEERGPGLEVPWLRWNLPWNAVRPTRDLVGVALEPHEAAQKHKREGDPEPKQHDGDHGPEGDGAGGALGPDDEVDQEEHGKHNAREHHARPECALEQVLFLEKLAEPSGEPAGDTAQKTIEQQHR